MSGKTNYPGIDYSLGQSNVNPETGIHFGVINMNALNEWAWESFDADYGEATCPECLGEVHESTPDVEGADKDYYCAKCQKSYWSDQVYGDEPIGHTLDDGEYKGFLDSRNDVMLLSSPYYTHAQFCSPCAPGAGYLANPCPTGPKTYCFSHDWFDNDIAPYPVYKVETGELVPPPERGDKNNV